MSCRHCGKTESFYYPSDTGCERLKENFCPNCGNPLSVPTPLNLEKMRGKNGEPVWVEIVNEKYR